MHTCACCSLTLNNWRLSKISNTATFKNKVFSWLLAYVSQSGSLSGMWLYCSWSTEFWIELSPLGKGEKKGNGKIRSLEGEETLTPHADFTEFVCVPFQNVWEGLWDITKEAITLVSIYCADCVEWTKTGLRIWRILWTSWWFLVALGFWVS